MTGTKNIRTAPDFAAMPWLRHGFLTRHHDSIDAAARIIGADPARFVRMKQVHGRDVFIARAANADRHPDADGIVTTEKNLAIAVYTADCVPVLFADPAGVIGAAHAGWGGALKGVLESTVDTMVAQGADRATITAAIGPCIGADSYEVSTGFETPFLAENAESAAFFKPAKRDGHLMFDIGGYAAYRLKRAGVAKVFSCNADTYAHADDYHSYRRSVHAGSPTADRQFSVIMINDDPEDFQQ